MDNNTKIHGVITNIRFRSSEDFAIFTLFDEQGVGEITCKGTIPATTDIGDTVTITGKHESSAKYGKQFALTSCLPEKPDINSNEGVIRLLMKLPGIGNIKAGRIVKKHGYEKAWEMALRSPEKIGIKKSDIDQARDISCSLTVNYDALVYLMGVGVTDNEAGKIIKRYGKDAIDTVQNNPYVMIQDIEGFGFAKTDGIALKSGISPSAQTRVMAAIMYILDSSENDGNIWLPANVLIAKATEFLQASAEKHRISLLLCPGYSEVKKAALALKAEKKIVIKDQMIFSAKLLDCEREIMEALS